MQRQSWNAWKGPHKVKTLELQTSPAHEGAMRNFLRLVGSLGVTSALLYACSSSETPAVPADGSASAPEASTPVEAGVVKTDAGTDAAPTGGTSCANAISVNLGEETAGNFKRAGESLYYSVKVDAGAFLILSADTGATSANEDTVVDTAINVFDTTGAKLLAAIDDAFPRASTSASLYYRSPTATTLCVQVTDLDTWSGLPPKLAPDASFKFFALALDPTKLDLLSSDTEPNDTTAAAQAGKLRPFTTPPGAFGYVIGTLKDANDVDMFKFTVPAGAVSMSVEMPPIGAPVASGKSSYGSTLPRFVASIKKLDGTTIAELAPPAGQTEKTAESLGAPVEPGDYILAISRPAGVAPGANDFYATTVQFTTGNPAEAEVTSGANDTLATAETIALKPGTADPKRKSGFILARLPTGDAADNFSFPVAMGDSISVACGALRNGSGLQGFKAELFVGGESRQSETEVATADIAWSTSTTASKPAVAVTAAGTAVLQLTATGRSATNTGTYYLCGVHVTSP